MCLGAHIPEGTHITVTPGTRLCVWYMRVECSSLVPPTVHGCGCRLIITSRTHADRELKQRWAESWYQQDLTKWAATHAVETIVWDYHVYKGGFRCCHWTTSVLPAKTWQHTWSVRYCRCREVLLLRTHAMEKSFANSHKTSKFTKSFLPQ